MKRGPLIFGTTSLARAALRQITGAPLGEVEAAMQLGSLLARAELAGAAPRWRRARRAHRYTLPDGRTLLLWADDRGVIHDVELTGP